MDEIELESRDWLKKNASGLTGQKLATFLSILDEGRRFDVALPEVQDDVAKKMFMLGMPLYYQQEKFILTEVGQRRRESQMQ